MSRRELRWVVVFRNVICDLIAWIDGRLLAMSAVLVVVIFPSYMWFDLENRVYDFYVKARYLSQGTAPSPGAIRVALVLVDDQAVRMDVQGRLYEGDRITSRSYLAELVRAITDPDALPKVLALDILLDVRVSAHADDNDLSSALRAIQDAGVPVVLATRLVPGALYSTNILPLPGYLDQLNQDDLYLGHVNIDTDRVDGVVRVFTPAKLLVRKAEAAPLIRSVPLSDIRYYQEVERNGEQWYFSPSFAFQMLRAYSTTNSAASDATLASLISDRRLRKINFTYEDIELVTLSSATVLAGTAARILRGRLVLIGSGFARSQDRKRTPLSTQSMITTNIVALDRLEPDMLGARLHVYTLRSLNRMSSGSDSIWQWSDVTILAAGLPFVLVLGWLYLRSSAGWPFAVVWCGALVGWILFSAYVFRLQLWYVPVVRPVGLLVVSFLIFRALKRRLLSEETDTAATPRK